ncbi:Multifunctional cytochrome P450 monooxygenase [Cladobotryum mycophilum]|uniref:Multifunctional cytochrome P450 monooxygenase n=1 Tax=Cladobotryum mycophilum TaxID=491253 RepID=A0ABR0SVT9_9HYPO
MIYKAFSMANLPIIQALIALVAFLVCYQFFRKPYRNLPPGPKGIPFIGNIFDLPPKGTIEFEHWLKHKNLYGPISSLTIFGNTMIFIHGRHAIYELMEKQSVMSSGRPLLEFLTYCGFGKFMVMHQLQDHEFKTHRKGMHSLIGTKSLVAKFAHSQEVEARRLLLRILKEPNNIMGHLKIEVTAVILKSVYGYTVDPQEDDPLVTLIERTAADFEAASIPFNQTIDIVPVFKYLPQGFPGTGFKKTAQRYARNIRDTVNIPFGFVRQQITKGNNYPSYVSKLVEQSCADSDVDKLNADNEDMIKWSAAIMYLGGSETLTVQLSSFLVAMMLFPEVHRKAQEEIDRVTSGTRLPLLSDREAMPYMGAVVSEVLRWHPVAPLAVPHVADEELTYNGYTIPKGAVLFGSIWWLAHDPEVYQDPDSFVPERFLEPRNEQDPRTWMYGFGRRVCPGRYLAESVMFLTFTHILATCIISKARDNEGREIVPKLEPNPGMTCHISAFPYEITPRSKRHTELIQNIEQEHPWEQSDSIYLEGLEEK